MYAKGERGRIIVDRHCLQKENAFMRQLKQNTLQTDIRANIAQQGFSIGKFGSV